MSPTRSLLVFRSRGPAISHWSARANMRVRWGDHQHLLLTKRTNLEFGCHGETITGPASRTSCPQVSPPITSFLFDIVAPCDSVIVIPKAQAGSRSFYGA